MSFENNVRVFLATPLSSGANAVTCTNAVAPFNNPPAEGVVTITDDFRSPTVFEIMRYTSFADNGDGTFTLSGLTRGLEGTGDSSWGAGAGLFMAVTAGQLDEMNLLINAGLVL